jgi:D-alanine transfer protein
MLHLRAAVLTALLLGLAAEGGLLYARGVEARAVYALAPDQFQTKHLGLALQQAAFRSPDLLPIYGSSEFETYVGPYTASAFFASAPTGFSVFAVGSGGMTPLLILERLTAVGADVRGKKVVILASPTFVRGDDKVRQAYYTGNFSPLHGYEVAFGSSLSRDLQRELARRMLEYPETLEQEPLLGFALRHLVDDSPTDRLLYSAAWPLGRLRTLFLRAQDHWLTASLAASAAPARVAPTALPMRKSGQPDWEVIRDDAETMARDRSASNDWGFSDNYWQEHGADLTRQRGRLTDQAFLRTVKQDADWTDFELLLRGLRELGAEPLLLSVPMKGGYYEYWGVSERARDAYYRQIRLLADRNNVPVRTFAEADGDPLFNGDERSHPSQLGWVAYDQAIDAFYRGHPR